ncbi:response regulator [Kitasatospora aureofaciens]|uniref:response regulator n=1 Tax=Kitasatospora aureofaciens TaxID=1894 RepID=UPI0037F5063C
MRVLVVEDDADLRFAVVAALRGSGLAVDEAADLPAADEALFATDYDCAVFDRMVPSGDALDYVRKLRGNGGTVPVLFLTARDTVTDRVEGFACGGDDYLAKPGQADPPSRKRAGARDAPRPVRPLRATVPLRPAAAAG